MIMRKEQYVITFLFFELLWKKMVILCIYLS